MKQRKSRVIIWCITYFKGIWVFDLSLSSILALSMTWPSIWGRRLRDFVPLPRTKRADSNLRIIPFLCCWISSCCLYPAWILLIRNSWFPRFSISSSDSSVSNFIVLIRTFYVEKPKTKWLKEKPAFTDSFKCSVQGQCFRWSFTPGWNDVSLIQF